jgi:UDP-hydrolysing UDP-N-acetyl-D-glucosamine 2-epimerase
MKKKIAIFTGNRAEYGLQKPILQALKDNSKTNYYLIVSGSHLEKKFGKTINEIKKDKFKISHLIKLKNTKIKNLTYTPIIISELINKICFFLKKIKPDALIVNADRFETFGACIASSQMNIPTIHIEGGDLTEGGALDDNVRHAISKLSHLHFVTNINSYKNLIKMGEERSRIFNVGLASNDLIKKQKLVSKNILNKNFRFNNNRIIIVTFHSFGTNLDKIKKDMDVIKKVITYYSNKNYTVIATYPNNDYGSNVIIQKLNLIKKNLNKKNFILKKSLGNNYFYSLLNLAKDNRVILVGNSSAGIKECIRFKCPAINIGERQSGRLKPQNVKSVKCDFKKILNAIEYTFENKQFRKKLKYAANPYFKKNTGKRIVNIISKIKFNSKFLNKKHIF